MLKGEVAPSLSVKFSSYSCLPAHGRRNCNCCGFSHYSYKFPCYDRRFVCLKRNTSAGFYSIFKLNFTQSHGSESVQSSSIPIGATVGPLTAKDIKPVLQPEEKSKVEETCETLKAKQQAETSKTLIDVLDEALQPKKVGVEPVKKSLMEVIVHEIKHYANGFKLLFINVRISLKQLWKVLNGQDLSRRERKLVRRMLNLQKCTEKLHSIQGL